MKTTALMHTSPRQRRITWGFGLAVGIGMIGIGPLFASLWPGFDHSPWDINTMLLGLGVGLCAIAYIFGRIAVAAVTEGRRNAVSPPTRRAYLVAGGGFVLAALALTYALATSAS
ncbi:hypothetical protein SAMN04488564_103256 [Lentzea waywayandensis]|uniref:Uncharacterized protein n=1 Tax=Lentzea waywayandensis TaxID=84724 RepID=A0A1I6DWN2_9PSEU|nr:hypothetical protein [Lentzea waywayandensis]SFR09873.1 hypothetical protein SAMN04488564_103256 [Lentzea waywayandensis]